MNCKQSRLILFFLFLSCFTYRPYATAEEISTEVEPITQQEISKTREKDWNFIVYIAANNNLHKFSIHNLKQMAQVGSTDTMNIVAQLDGLGNKEVNRYYVEEGKACLVNLLEHSQQHTSGTKDSLYNFVEWAIKNYPAKHQCIVLWNHGSGIKDPSIWGRMVMAHRDELFHINPTTGLLELDRDCTKFSNFEKQSSLYKTYQRLKKRGIAFNDTHEEYLTNQDLKETLEKISTTLLGGKKIDIVSFDACHMAMMEIASQIKESANFMVASEEVEPGSGYNYLYLLTPFKTKTMSPQEFAIHTVNAYKKEYHGENADYTQSAIDLDQYQAVEKNVQELTQEFNSLFSQKDSRAAKLMLKSMRLNKKLTTIFCDQDYVDFCHFYQSLQTECANLLSNEKLSNTTKKHLEKIILLSGEGLSILERSILNNVSGVNLPHAQGLSFYFPTRTVHKSYLKTVFHAVTGWGDFLNTYTKIRTHN